MKHSRLVAVALVLLGLGWLVAPRAALPLYDGVGFPDEPYRFVHAPSGAPDTDAPTTARGTAAVRNGRSGSLIAASAEVAPQVSLQVPPGLLSAPSGTTKVTVEAKPQAPLPTASGKYLWSNVYDVTASPGASLHTGDLQATITLRSATAQRPEPTIAHYEAGHWRPIPTFADGRDIYIAELRDLGRFAVIGTVPIDVTQLPGSTHSSGGGNKIGLIVGGGALIAIVALFLLGRRRRALARQDESGEEDETYVDADEDEGGS